MGLGVAIDGVGGIRSEGGFVVTGTSVLTGIDGVGSVVEPVGLCGDKREVRTLSMASFV